MVKRKCGTCRHFKDGGIAGSGWCQHHARKDIQHMVLVRKTELACRNSWDQDLWELADRPMDIQASAHVPLPLSGGEPQDVPLIRAESPADDAERAGEMFTDRITSISMPTRSQLRPGRVEPEHTTAEADATDLLGARSSVREARKRRQEQRHLERKRHQETVLQRADDLLDTSKPADEADLGITRIRAVDGPMTANRDQRHEPRDNANDTDTPESPRRETSVPERTFRRKESTPSIEFSSRPATFHDGGKQMTPSPAPDPVAPKPGEKRNGAGGTAALARGETEPLPSAADVREAVSQQRTATAGPSEPAQPRVTSSRADPKGQTDNAPRREPPGDLPPAVDPRPTTWFTGAGHIAQPAIAGEPAAPFAVDPIDLSRDLKSVRRCCATCRDFKQVGDGRTGWCNNPYAFNEKRMVQSNEIACRSSLGVWWLPHDDLWLEYADTTHHGRPTPLLDDMVGAVPAGRQGMGQRSS